MKIKDLIKELKELDPERIIVMSKDSEGNNFSPLSEIEEGSYEEESSYNGEFGLEKLTPKLKKAGYDEENIIEGKKAICFWPIN